MYIWKVGTSEHWRKHRDSRLAKTRTHCCALAEEQWLEVSMAGTSSSAYRPIEAKTAHRTSETLSRKHKTVFLGLFLWLPITPRGPGGAAGPGPCMRHPPAPPPPPRIFRDSGLGIAPTAPPFFNVCFLFIKPSMLLSARYRKTRRYTNVVCCEVLSAEMSKTGRLHPIPTPPADPPPPHNYPLPPPPPPPPSFDR